MKVWIAAETLTASDLNAEFNNILNNPRSLVSPFTGLLDMNGNEIVLDGDGDTSITASNDDQIDIRISGADDFKLTANLLDVLSGSTLNVNAGATHKVAGVQILTKGADVTAAADLLVDIDGNIFDVAGATTITTIATKGIGTVIRLHFDEVLLLTHHSTNLILPGGADIVTAAGDEAEFYEYASADWRCTNYTKVSGREIVPPRGLIDGLTLSNNSGDAAKDIDIAKGEATDDGQAVTMVLSSTLVKRIDAAWSVGTNQGGLDGTESVGGTPDASEWYHVWLIRRSDTGVVDVLFSESATGPTMPTNYDQKRRIGAVLMDATPNILAFNQHGDEFYWETRVKNVDDTTPSTSQASFITTTPLGIRLIAIVTGHLNENSSTFIQIRSTADANVVPSATDCDLSSGGADSSNTNELRRRTSLTSTLNYRSTNGTVAEFTISTVGWVDPRGKD